VTESKRRGGRPRKPAVIRNKDGSRSVRLTMEVEGEVVRKTVRVGTSDPAVARARARRLAAGEAPDLLAKKSATFEEHARELMAQSTLRTKKDRLSRLVKYAFPKMGDIPVADIVVGDIEEALAFASEAVGWTGLVRHLKNDISAILGTLYSKNIIKENAALRISFKRKDNALGGRKIQRVVLPRIVLSDEEFEQFLAYGLEQAAEAGTPGQLSELYMLALCARCLGGMRTSDLHAWRWEHVDTRSWQETMVPRPKTQGHDLEEWDERFDLEPYELPEELVPFLAGWWRRNGCPTEGPVFPVRKGKRLGMHKDRGTSYATPLREALWEAKVYRPQPGFRFDKPDPALCALQSGIARRRACVDFHSFRRAFVTATTSKRAGLSMAESMRLADHSDPATHARYRRDEGARVIPGSVLPNLANAAGRGGLGSGAAKTRTPSIDNPQSFQRRARGGSNPRPTAPEAGGDVLQGRFPAESASRGTVEGRGGPWIDETQRQNSDPLRAAVDNLIALGQLEMAEELLARSRPARKAPVLALAKRSKK
jgi:integrase